MEPKLTICIPTYRRAKLLRRCLQKLYEVDDLNFRVIVGNNASPDDTEEEVQNYLGRNGFSYFRNSENVGGDLNVVKIISMVKTKFFMILTDDDYVNASGLRRLVSYCDSYPNVGAILSPLYAGKEENKVVHIRGKFSKIKVEEPGLRSIGKYADLAWTWSRLVFECTGFDLAKAQEKAAKNCYFMIIMLAEVCRSREVLIIPDQVVFHTIENEVFWETLGPSVTERQVSMEQKMLAVMQEIYPGSTLYEWWKRTYYQYLIAAKYIHAANGLQALKKTRGNIDNDRKFIAQNFKGTARSGPGLAVFGLARLIQLKRFVRVHLLTSIGTP